MFSMISMTVPGLTEFSDINLVFLRLQKDSPDVFLDNVRIESVYGGVPGAKFCGGRNSFGACADLGAVQDLLATYAAYGVACNLTYTNQLVDQRALETSTYSIKLLEILAARDTADSVDAPVANGVIVHSDALDRYIRDAFPQLRRISSTTKELVAEEAIVAELTCFDRVVLNYNLTKDRAVISRLPNRDRLEVMVNEYCTLGCPNRQNHYRHISLDQMRGKRTTFTCACAEKRPPQALGFLNGLINGDVFLRNEEIRSYHDDLGITWFKIVGRELARYDVIDSYLYYLIKPEYWYEVRDLLLSARCV